MRALIVVALLAGCGASYNACAPAVAVRERALSADLSRSEIDRVDPHFTAIGRLCASGRPLLPGDAREVERHTAAIGDVLIGE